MFLQIESVLQDGSSLLAKIQNKAIDYAPKVIGAILVYIIGSFIISRLANVFRKVMERRQVDISLQKFLTSLIKAVLTVLLFIALAGMVGVDITAFAAILAGLGLAIGAALNGSLGNLAGGVMLMIFKPFKVGDIIDAQGSAGVVQEIGIFATTILSPENKTIIIPNGSLSTGVITNFNTHGNLRVDLTMAIALDQDIDKARAIAIAAMKEHPKVLQTPAPEVNVLKVGDGMVQLAVRPYTTQDGYWDVFFGAQEQVKKAWDAAGIEGPTPTRIIISK